MIEIVLVRHGETDWSRERRHSGRTDIQLTEHGHEHADALRPLLAGRRYASVLTSPLSRAVETCLRAGLGEHAELRPDLVEWDYGAYEGLTTAEIRAGRPGWTLWSGGVDKGESVEEVAQRVDRVIDELRQANGDIAVFAHGHVLRVLAARWLGLEPSAGRLFVLDAGAVSVLGYEHEVPVVRAWNLKTVVDRKLSPGQSFVKGSRGQLDESG
jgi:probable phosphoglycerate mutase